MPRYSYHAQDRMQKRRITKGEVEEVLSGSVSDTPGWTPKERNLWGTTTAGRRLRITVRSHDYGYIISVVAPEEES